jgi:hypothetical protein
LRTHRHSKLNRILWVFAFLCLAGAVWYLPFFYPFFRNEITAPPPTLYAVSRVQLPYSLTNPDKNVSTDVYITLRTDTNFVVGEPLNLTVTIFTSAKLARNMTEIDAIPDDALYVAPQQYQPIFSYVKMNIGDLRPDLATWLGSRMIEYTVTGSFGLGLIFVGSLLLGNTTYHNVVLGATHTNPLFSVSSQDSLILKKNLSLTTSLTCLLLFFVVLDFIRLEENREDTQSYTQKSPTVQ